MGKVHKHRDLIIAWANGADIQVKTFDGNWICLPPLFMWAEESEYRIKPKDHDCSFYLSLEPPGTIRRGGEKPKPNVRAVFDHATLKLKLIEIVE